MNPDMNRLKLLAAIAVLGLPLAACEETTPPPPVGSIVGTVSIEGTGIDGVSVNLSNGNTTTTAGGGSFRFDNVEGGAYTVTISGYPSDATFDATSAAATIASAGQSVTVNFSGAYIRTASVMGTVTVENMGLGGVTVALSGVSSASAVTDDNGQYAFTGLRMGNYSVEISGFDNDEVGFSATAASVTVGVGESKIISFDGTYLRTAGIMGQVSVEGAGLEGVTVSLAGGPDATDMTTMTDASGQYSFSKLRAGDYAVGISGYDTDDYEFEVTSENVTVALGETANVPFEGVLLRTAGVSGRVSVEGIGLEDVMVTLSMADADDMMAMTDAGGLYAFSGLAAGDYTVAIALSDEQMAAYVFEMTSEDVTLEDDMTSIVNFEAEHAATASVTVKLFIDEAMKNDMMDEGEGAFPTEAMLAMVAELGLPLALPISLAGPGVHDMQSGTAMADGSVVFAGLKAGQYQVIVSNISAETLAALPPALGAVLRDYSYGGPATGYPVALTVGQEAMQYAPIDITHTTVNFGVTLKNGETRGAPLPGAMVTLYADAMGETKVADMMTDSMGMAAIRFARAGTTGNMVHAAVSAADDYTVGEGMQAVMWDPQKTYTMAANDNDIVNLNVDLTYGGATITTGYGGGDALAGWAVSVAHGDTMYADTLDAMGMAAFKMTVDSAGALPAMFAISVDTIQDNKLDGGESFEGTSVDHVHTGLALAGTMDAGTMEVNYTTQSLVVGAHHERDQVMGYTGNVLDGDERDDGNVSLSIRYIDGNGRSRSFTAKEWNPKNATTKDGVTTFTGLPADENIIVQASVADDAGVMLLDPDELAAYTAMEENGVVGGAFGDMGGFSHTVSLCPLQAEDPQDHGECSSFAYVSTYSVGGLVWRASVAKDKSDGFEETDPDFTDEVTFGITPVDGKNLAGEEASFDALAKESEKDKGDDHAFTFEDVAAGNYKLDIPDGWRVRTPKDGEETKGATGMVTNQFSPLKGDIALDVTPATATVYGRVNGTNGFPLDSVTVTANGVSAMTDVHGRYIIEGIAAQTRKISGTTHTNMIFLSAGGEGYEDSDLEIFDFVANSLAEKDIDVEGVQDKATITGTIRAAGTNEPVAGVLIMVDDEAPANAPKSDSLLTGADGTYTAEIEALGLGTTALVSASKDGMSFQPPEFPVAAHKGAKSNADFTGYLHATITGRVVAPGGGPLSGVTVTATVSGAEDGTAATDTDMTGTTGTFSLSVPFDRYTIEATAAEGSLTRFTYPDDDQDVRVAPGLDVNFGSITGKSVAARNVTAARQTDADGNYDGNVVVTMAWDTVAGFSDEARNAQSSTDDGETWSANIGLDEVEEGTPPAVVPGKFTFTVPTDAGDGDFHIRIETSAEEDPDGDGPENAAAVTPENSATDPVDAVDPTAAIVNKTATPTARRVNDNGTADVTTDDFDELVVSWTASTNTNTLTRVVMSVEVSEGRHEWLVAEGAPANAIGSTVREWTLNVTGFDDGGDTSWELADGSGSFTVSTAALQKALMVRVETQQPGVTQDDMDMDIWVESNTMSVAAKPTS